MARRTAALLVALIGGANPFVLPGAPRVSTLQTPRRPHRTALQMARDLYETLGVPRGSDDRTIKRAFRDAARKWHPDVNDTPEAAERYKDCLLYTSDAADE